MNDGELICYKTFIDQYYRKEIHFLNRPKHRKKFEISNKTINLAVAFLPSNSVGVEKLRQVYISKHNSKRENQVVLSMVTDDEK